MKMWDAELLVRACGGRLVTDPTDITDAKHIYREQLAVRRIARGALPVHRLKALENPLTSR
jgi:hypothetical protein